MPDKRTVDFFFSGDFPEGNGSNSRLKDIALNLHSAGYHIRFNILWPSEFNNHKINHSKGGVYRDYIHYHYLDGITRAHSKLGKFFQILLCNLLSAFDFIRRARSIRTVYLMQPALYSVFLVAVLCRLSGKRLIVEFVELNSSFFHGKRKNLLYYLGRAAEYIFPRLAHQLVVISSELEEYFRKSIPGDKIIRIPIMVNLKRFDNERAERRKFLVSYIGSFGEKDGVKGIILAFARALQKEPRLRMRLIGYSDNYYEVKKLIAERKLSDEIEITGMVSYDELPKILKHADLFIVNRINTPYSRFGFPNKLGEYLACQSPVIATQVGDTGKMLEHEKNIYFVEAGNDEQLADAIILRYREYERFDELGKNGRIACENLFSHSNFQKLHAELVNNFQPKKKDSTSL